MSQPTPVARSAVDVLADLVTQVKRIADHTASGSFALALPPVVDPDDDATTGDDDGPTTPVRKIAHPVSAEAYAVATEQTPAAVEDALPPSTTCSARYVGGTPPLWCIRAAGHPEQHTDSSGFHWRDDLAVYPTDSTIRIGGIFPMPEQQFDEMQDGARLVGNWAAAGVRDLSIPEQRPAPADDATCRRMETRTCPQPYNGPCGERPCARFESDDPAPWLDTAETTAADDAPSGPVVGHATIGITAAYHGEQAPASEQTLRWLRRESLLVLLTRISRGRLFGEDEARTLRTYVETEMTEAEAARAELLRSENARDHLRQRAESAERDLRTLRSGLRAAGGDPTQIQNLWAQLRLRNRQWAEVKREARAFRAMLEAEGGDVALVDEMLDTVAAAEAKARDAEQKLSDAETLGHKLLKRAETAEAAAQREARVSASLVRSTKLLLERRTTRLLERADRAEAATERVRGLRDPIAKAIELADYSGKMRRGDLADSVMPVILAALDGTEQTAADESTADEPTTCTATIVDSLGSDALIRCVAPAGHYNQDNPPVFPTIGESDPRGWHRDSEEGRVWSDEAAAATPHGAQPTTEVQR